MHFTFPLVAMMGVKAMIKSDQEVREWPWFIHAKYISLFKTELSSAKGHWGDSISTPAWKYLLEKRAILHYSNTSGGRDLYMREVNLSTIRRLLREHYEDVKEQDPQQTLAL